MAFQFEKEVKGITCNYWRLSTYFSNCMDNNNTVVNLALYPSKEVRQKSLGNSVESYSITIDGTGLSVAEIYQAIREKEFSDEGVINPFYQLEEY